MTDSEFPAPHEGFVVTHFLVVSDQDRSREFYRSVFGATVVLERDPVILKIANSWLILNVGGGPTDDKPTVTLAPPADPERASAFLNIRVADIAAVYAEWSAKGAEFLTEPKDHAHEIRAYIRDPDGHLIEVGQAKAPPGAPLPCPWIHGRKQQDGDHREHAADILRCAERHAEEDRGGHRRQGRLEGAGDGELGGRDPPEAGK